MIEPSAALSDGLTGGTAVRIERKFTSAPRISLVVQSSSGGPFRSRWIESIFDGFACVEPHCLAGCDLDGLSGLWIPPFTCRPRRHIENAKSGDTDRIPGHEGIENGIYHGLHRLARRSMV